MKLYIKTNTYADEHKDYELMVKHEFKIFGKVFKWYTKYRELVEKTGSIGYEHFKYTSKELCEHAKKIFESGPEYYKGFAFYPLHRYYISFYGEYLVRYKGHNMCGTLPFLKKNIDNLLEVERNNKLSQKITKSIIENEDN